MIASVRPSGRRISGVLAFAALGLACAGIAHAAGPGDPADTLVTFRADTTTIMATGDLHWEAWFTIRNAGPQPLLLDSLRCEVTDLDPDAPRGAGPMRIDLQHLLRIVKTVDARSSDQLQFSGPAYAEYARIDFILKGHASDGTPFTRVARITALPGPYSIDHPSRFLTAGGRRIEYVPLPARNTTLAAPGILLIHGHGGRARTMLHMGLLLSLRGYAVTLMSMPGYGGSEGPVDLMGPATMAAARAVLDSMRANPGVDAKRLAAWGVSRGATVAALLGIQRPEVGVVIAQSGIYDLWATYRDTKLPGFREAIVSEAGRDSAAWKARSPLLAARQFQGSILVLHGEADPNVPAAQAHDFVNALQAAGRNASSHFFPGAGHELPRSESQRMALEYLKQHLVN